MSVTEALANVVSFLTTFTLALQPAHDALGCWKSSQVFSGWGSTRHIPVSPLNFAHQKETHISVAETWRA